MLEMKRGKTVHPFKRELVPAAGLKDGHHLGPQIEAPSWTDSLELFMGPQFFSGFLYASFKPTGVF